MRRREDPNQTLIDWGNQDAAVPAAKLPDPVALAAQAPPPLVERLPWDFSTTFPQPTEEAIDAGVVDESDLAPDNLRGLHDSYIRQCLAVMQELDVVMDARRRGIDPATGKQPMRHAARERLKKYLADAPATLEHTFNVLIETYENGFGIEAAHAFARYIRARHAGIPVEIDRSAMQSASSVPPEAFDVRAERPARRPHPGSSRLPVPRPLAEAVKAAHFGFEENGRPVNPSPDEVRAITEQHAEKIIEMLQGRRQMERSHTAPSCGDRARVGAESKRLEEHLRAAIDKYAASFGEGAAAQLDRYCRRQILVERGR